MLILNEICHYPRRIVDIDDIILNTTGACAGIFIFHILKHTKLYKLIFIPKDEA